jgi:hypothetical protein
LLEPPNHNLKIPAGVLRVGIHPQDTSERLLRLEQTSAAHVTRTLTGILTVRLTTQTVCDTEVVRGRLIDTPVSGRRRSLKGLDRPFPITRKQQGRTEIIPIPGLSFALSPSTQFFQEVGGDLPDHRVGSGGVLEQRSGRCLLASQSRNRTHKNRQAQERQESGSQSHQALLNA